MILVAMRYLNRLKELKIINMIILDKNNGRNDKIKRD